jgi:hypothetical protein
MKIHRTIIFPVILHGCETWLLTLREECRQRVFENGVLRRLFGPKGDNITVEWRKLHYEELNYLYPSDQIKKMKWTGHVVLMGGEVHRASWWGKPKGKRPLERCRRRWQVNIEMDVKVVG